MRSAALLGLAALGAALAGCGSPAPVTYVWVDVQARPAVRGLTKLEVTVEAGGSSVKETFGDGSTELPLPSSFTVTTKDGVGPLTLTASGYDRDGHPIGRGTITVTVVAGARADASLLLETLDFQVNTTLAGSQIVTDFDGRAGRQIAATPGNIAIAFENVGTMSRYDGLCRLFDGDGVPRQNATSKSTDDFVVNQFGTASVYYLSVTGAPDGGFLATWYDMVALNVMVRRFDASGAGANETAVSVPDAQNPGAGAVATFADGSFVVVWSQELTGQSQREVRARLLDGTGQPRVNATTNTDADFPVGSTTTRSRHQPGVAVGPDGGFLVAWFETDGTTNSIVAQKFSGNGRAVGAELLLRSLSESYIEAPNLAAMVGGYVMVFTDTVGGTVADEVFATLLGADGVPVVPAYRINTTTEANQYEPAIGVAADGSLLIVWTNEQSGPDDNDPTSIRGRALHPFGLPIGLDFPVNTTTAKYQYQPSVGLAASGAFVVSWIDESTAGPDTDLAGIRARLVYPDFVPPGGGLGGRCDDGTCQEGFSCVARQLGPYCHPNCAASEVGQACAGGGVCTAPTAANTAVPVCVFR